MNLIITQHFDAVEVRIIQSRAIVSYQVVRREISPVDGKLRIKMTLTDGGIAEFVEYVTEVGGKINLSKYSFHWQNAQGKLKRRWDNAPHHSELPNSPHHVHNEDGIVLGIMTVPDIFYFIEQIEYLIHSEK
jgi:hypothetical protein